MLKVTKRFEYGLLAVRYIAVKGSVCSAKEIATEINISYEFVSKALQLLTKNGIVVSEQGVNGGYRLGRSARDISFSEIADALGEKVNVVDCSDPNCSCDGDRDCAIKDPMLEIQTKIKKIFDNATVAKVI